jgi:intracellular multiplication protein IcmL
MTNNFYRNHYQNLLIGLSVLIILMLIMVMFVLYQITHRPVPTFTAVDTKGQSLILEVHDEPNFLPGTLTRWAGKAAVSAYTFDFANYNKQLDNLRHYFTQGGWDNYRASISGLINSVIQNQVFISSVVIGMPVIIKQGDFEGVYSWQIQMPFLVTTQSAETTSSKHFNVTLTIVKVPTWKNPAGIGIDQFVMA